jgi:hypothetical protein
MRSLGLELVRVGGTDIDADGLLATRLKQVIRQRVATHPEPPPSGGAHLHFNDSSPG